MRARSREDERRSEGSLQRDLERVARAASADLLSPSTVPRNLLGLVVASRARVARVALLVAHDLCAGDAEGLRRSLDFSPFYSAAAAHSSWWVRFWAALSLPWSRPRPRLITALLSDPVPAVVAASARLLFTIPLEDATDIFSHVRDENRLLVVRSLLASRGTSYALAEEFQAWVRSRPLAPDRIRRLLDANREPGAECMRLLEAIDPSGELRSKAEALDTLCATDITLDWSAEGIALLMFTSRWDLWIAATPDIVELCHPDPLVRELAAYWATESADHDRYDTTLLACLSDPDPGVVVSSLLDTYFREGSFGTARDAVARLLRQEHLLIEQLVARSLYGWSATEDPETEVVAWLSRLVAKEDARVRLNALVSLRGLPSLSRLSSVVALLLELWHTESGPVKLRLAEVLQRALPPGDWLELVGAELLHSPERHVRLFALDLWDDYCMYEPREASHAVTSFSAAPLRRRLRARLNRALKEGTIWQRLGQDTGAALP